ncbi:tumor necrosis factor receptor superfamily member 11A-like isoform X2 [Myxocyprinus asiaticus]|uniref:tumor necrosis factor receptor superfamily member 11A-like isoform X2 n=1 Tax=Myxocyprinus asiaticus TaxID=70543 RepID=UPI002222B9F1|nr:tumor necrosis factor receptor superfamily member 11A-like isoform X2 [Myxocyprinus asiaticus]
MDHTLHPCSVLAGLAISCLQYEYEYNGNCCSKCEPGKYVFAHCTGSLHTMCLDCGRDEYQPDWNREMKCIAQKFCDEGKGFNRTRPHNAIAAEPCRCKQGFHCSLINCEYCEAIKKCPAGEGVVMGETGRASCVPCQNGFFSESQSIEACKKWTDCKAIGKTVKQPGSSKTDMVCGLHSPGPMTPWVVVAILLVIIMVSLVILFLFCCKDKLNFLSVNLRTCVQNLKGSRNQQETVIPSYHCSNGPQTFPLICQEKSPPESLIMCPSTALTITDETSTCTDQEQADSSSGSSIEDSRDGPASPLSGSSCSCAFSMKEPIEVGENEDCSQLVATGLATCHSCRTGDAFDTKGENVQVINLKEPLLCENCSSEGLPACAGSADCDYVDLQRSQELYLDYSSPAGKEAMSEIPYRQNEPCCCSIESTTVPLLPSVSDNKQGLSLIDSEDLKLSNPDADTDYQNQCSEAAPTTGQVTGNNNTTFISSGQVMNFSGEVIVVYVSQTSLGSGGGTEEPFSCPVQEESNEDSFQSEPKSNIGTAPQGKNRAVHSERHLPVQEVTNDWSCQK